MVSTLASYRTIADNLSRWQTMTKTQPQIALATKYYLANVGKAKTIDAFIADTRVFNYAMTAYGLGDMTYAKGLMRKVLQGGVTNTQALANTMTDPRFKAFATAFDFVGKGTNATALTAAKSGTTDLYVQQALETNAGDQNDGIRLALYFKRKAGGLTNAYQVLADPALLKVVQTIFDIPASSSAQNIDAQARNISARLNFSDLKDTTKLNNYIARFAAQWDANNNQSSSLAQNLLPGLASNSGIGTDILLSMQKFRLGG